MSDDLISRKVLFDELSSLRIELNGISCRKEFKKSLHLWRPIGQEIPVPPILYV